MRRLLFALLLLPSFSWATSNLISTDTWSEPGDYKMARQDYIPYISGAFCSSCTINAIWNGTTISLQAAKGELITWATYLHASSSGDATNVMVKISSFTGTGSAAGSGFAAVAVSSTNVWDYTTRPYSLYKYSYLQLVGMNKVDQAWDASLYDAQQLPPRYRFACVLNGNNQCPPTALTEQWALLPDANKFYPDAAVPIEEFAISSFTVSASSSQAIGGEIYVSTGLPAGTYNASLYVYEGTNVSTTSISLTVYNVTLPATPSFPVIADLGIADLASRLNGNRNPANYYVDPYLTSELRAEAFLHRHKIITIGDQPPSTQDYPSIAYQKHIDGSAFRETYGLSPATSPGYGTGDKTYMIGTYGGWVSSNWSTTVTGGTNGYCTNVSSWTAYCVANALDCELYTPLDETDSTGLTGEVTRLATWSSTATACAFSGNKLNFFQTGDLPQVAALAPAVNTVASTAWLGASSTTWVNYETFYQGSSTNSVWGYNSGLGTDSLFALQEEGLGPREVIWGAHKTNQKGWFLWEINYWNDVNNGGQAGPPWNSNSNGDSNMFNIAKDFGYDNFPSTSAILGHTGFNFSNGDGNMLYYGTDTVFGNPNYGFNGVIGSWRLNQLTRGIEDIDLIKLAFAQNPSATTALVNTMVQDVMYLRGPFDNADPSFSYGPRPWNQSLNSWELARESLLQLAATGTTTITASQILGRTSFTGKGTLFLH